MSDIAQLGFKVDTKGLKRGEKSLNKFARTGEKTEKSLNKSSKSISQSFGTIAGSIGLVAAAIAGLTKLISVAREFDVLNAQLITATGSAEKAAKAFQGIQDFAAKTPFDLAQVTNSFVKLVNLGLTPSERALTSYGNTASAMGKSLNQLIEAVADAATGEFERLKEFGIKTKQQGDNVTFTFRGIATTVKKEASAIEGFLLDLGENEFAGAMQERVNTLDGAISNLGDSWDKLFLNISGQGIGGSIEDTVRLGIDALDELNDFIESGQLIASIDLISIKFASIADTVEEGVEQITMLFTAGSDIWDAKIGEFTGEAFKNLPENVKAIIQLVGVEIASLVIFAEEFGSAFGKILGIKLAQTVEEAKLFGRAIGQALNPFSESDFDLDTELERLATLSNEMTDEILANAEASAERQTQLRRDAIELILLERSASITSSDEQIKKIKELGDAFEKIKKARAASKKDSLAQFGLVVKQGKETKKITDKQLKDMEKLAKQVDKFGGSWSKTGSIIIDTFGSIADSLNDYINRLNSIGALEKELSKQREIFGKNNEEVIRLQTKLDEEKISAELSGIKSISSAFGSLFDEKTAASKAFAALNKIITVAEIALSFQKIVASNAETTSRVANETVKAEASGLSAITAAFAAPWPIGFVAGAAMIGIIASLLGGSRGGGGGGKSVSQQRQETQGTGTVLGAADDKSESILNALEMLVDVDQDQFFELRSIVKEMVALNKNITQFSASLVRSFGDFSGTIGGSLGETQSSLASLLSTGISFVDNIIGSFFGKKKRTLIDAGIKFFSQSLSDIISGGISAVSFADIKTKKKKFFRTSTSVGQITEQLDESLSDQLTLIFIGMGNTITSALDLLGLTTANDLQNFIVDIGEVSFKDLSGEEIQKELEAIFSQQADLMVQFVLPSIEKFQKIGEGLFETLVRVAKEQVIFITQIEQMGLSLSEVSKIIQIDVAQSIINLTGGLDKFNELSQSFFENFFTDAEQMASQEASLTSAFNALGLSLVTSREEFKLLTQGIDLTTEEGRELFAALLLINPALSDFIGELEKIEKKRVDLQIELLELTGNATEALSMQRVIELASLDATLRILQELIFAEEDRIALLKEQQQTAMDSFSMLERAIDIERERAEVALETAEIAFNAEMDRINGLREALESENDLRQSNLVNAEAILNSAFDAEIAAINESSKSQISAIQDIAKEQVNAAKIASKERLNALKVERRTVSDNMKSMQSLIKSVNQSLGLDKGLDLVSALERARAGDFAESLKLDFGALSKLDPSRFQSVEEFAIQQAINLNRLGTIGDLAQKELTESEKILASLDVQIDVMNNNSSAQLAGVNAASQAEIDEIQNSANAQISALEDQRNNLLDIDNSVLSVADAVAKFQEEQAALDQLNYDAQLELLDMLTESAEDVFALHEQGYADEMERLDGILETNEALLNAALGIDNSVLSVADAIETLTSSIHAILTTPIGSVTVPGINIPPPPKGGTIEPPPEPPIATERVLSELKETREENKKIQMAILRNTTTSANALQQFKLDGMDVRDVT